jgi:hypothetical protein
MQGMFSNWIYSGYNSDSGSTFTHEWNFPPMYIVAQCSIHYCSGGGLHQVGIFGYRYLAQDGSDQPVWFGDWPSWPSDIYVDQCTSVTFGTAVGAAQEVTGLLNFFVW